MPSEGKAWLAFTQVRDKKGFGENWDSRLVSEVGVDLPPHCLHLAAQRSPLSFGGASLSSSATLRFISVCLSHIHISAPVISCFLLPLVAPNSQWLCHPSHLREKVEWIPVSFFVRLPGTVGKPITQLPVPQLFWPLQNKKGWRGKKNRMLYSSQTGTFQEC